MASGGAARARASPPGAAGDSKCVCSPGFSSLGRRYIRSNWAERESESDGWSESGTKNAKGATARGRVAK